MRSRVLFAANRRDLLLDFRAVTGEERPCRRSISGATIISRSPTRAPWSNRWPTACSESSAPTGQWQGDTLSFARSGVKGAIAVTASDVHVTAELGMLLSPLKGTIEDEIRRKLDEKFA